MLDLHYLQRVSTVIVLLEGQRNVVRLTQITEDLTFSYECFVQGVPRLAGERLHVKMNQKERTNYSCPMTDR